MKRTLVLEYTKAAEDKTDFLNKIEAAFDSSFPDDAVEWWAEMEKDISIGSKIVTTWELVPPPKQGAQMNDNDCN